ncbi:Por secretion system C-terminal sorting domain-containing protein [Aquiflexum balticum DSM 16537]|uniref:Por secretion system C-terminal sorting domain-containing protein n=2 Tax=Aquiflexum TaxID=280472 RepID=A0A1W2H0T6_9BACT|nr:Por secretion system C-terminal sorting domain-containing protein [Aquiflexum balticum DSM 16537]
MVSKTFSKMDFFKDNYFRIAPNSGRIYWNYIVFTLMAFLIGQGLHAQIPLEVGDFRTVASGDFDNISIWEVWNGTDWQPAGGKPSMGNNIFIDFQNEIRLTGNESVNTVYFNAEGSTGNKINLQIYAMEVFGSFRLMVRSGSDYVTVGNSAAMTLNDWIYPVTGEVIFKGSSRNVVDRSSWSAQNTRSKFTVIFDPDPGETLTVNAALKSTGFIIQSGTVFQTLNSDGIPACSTFSFNDQPLFNGTGPFGDFIIEPGATLISECHGSPNPQIIRRTNAIPANLFHLKPGGNLVLLGNEPVMDAANFLFEGNVYYRSNSGNQRLVRTSLAGSGNPKTYNNLLFENASNKLLPDSVFLRGDFARLSGGDILEGPTYLKFEGSGIQQVVNWQMDLQQIEVNKPSGRVVLSSDLRAKSNFFMKQGQVVFNGFDLFVNTSGSGILEFMGGRWLNLHRLHYQNIPVVLNSTNATFPFEDTYQGGIRKIQLRGNSPGGNLSIRFIEIPGANWDPMFDDSDGTPILYQLKSYFEFSDLSPSTEDIEMRISAENLIVDDVDDIRIVSNGIAAPGSHLPGTEPDTLWARRDLQFGALNGVTFTVGSYRTLSILPVTWLDFQALWKNGETQISWSTAKESDNKRFLIYRSLNGLDNYHLVGEVLSKGNSETVQQYSFSYVEKLTSANVYFRIKQVDQNGEGSYGKVFRLEGFKNPVLESNLRLWPNPYTSGPIHISVPDNLNKRLVELKIFDSMGHIHYSGSFAEGQLEQILESLHPGLYLLELSDNKERHLLRFVKK